ncbi:hypothetical protein HPB47_000203 [Ixodes persulcatus]|uniref:Uncharacterized protein n=1 Tax=Ixodes persulcatus TaxID=34615 RepID=A0AC60PSE2_IXOPE|nr:hypothetical protein HPB47_000203 [Ixodes persulcatus]
MTRRWGVVGEALVMGGVRPSSSEWSIVAPEFDDGFYVDVAERHGPTPARTASRSPGGEPPLRATRTPPPLSSSDHQFPPDVQRPPEPPLLTVEQVRPGPAALTPGRQNRPSPRRSRKNEHRLDLDDGDSAFPVTVGLPDTDNRREPALLPPQFSCPPECLDLLASLDAPFGVPRALDVVLGPARPCAALVDGLPTLALLAQAIREAGIPTLSSPFVPVSGRSPAAGSSRDSSVSSRASASAESDELSPDDSLAEPSPDSDTGAWRMQPSAFCGGSLFHQPFPLPGDTEDDDDGSSDSRRQAAFPSGPPHFPLEVLRAAVTSMLDAGIIEPTVRGPYLSPIQVVPKTSTSSRFVLDCSHLTPHLPSPPFVLPALPKALQICPLPRTPFFTKIDLRDAFYHFHLSPPARALTRFRLDGCYYQYTVLPFGIRPAPFFMQSLATAFAREARSRGLWAWTHLDNILLAHTSFSFLRDQTVRFVDDLLRCGFRLNPADSQYHPTQRITFLGFFLDGATERVSHTPGRFRDLARTLEVLKRPQSLKTYQRLAGLWTFNFSLFGGHYHALRPLHVAAATGRPVDPQWVELFSILLLSPAGKCPFPDNYSNFQCVRRCQWHQVSGFVYQTATWQW